GGAGGGAGAINGLSRASCGSPCVYSRGIASKTATANACSVREVNVVQMRCEPEPQLVSSKLSENMVSSCDSRLLISTDTAGVASRCYGRNKKGRMDCGLSGTFRTMKVSPYL